MARKQKGLRKTKQALMNSENKISASLSGGKSSVYNDKLISRFVNNLHIAIKKSDAERIFSRVLNLVEMKSGRDPVEVVYKALANSQPDVELRSRRVENATLSRPVPVRLERAQALAIRWLIDSARKRPEVSMIERLALELIEASKGSGGAVARRNDVHRMASALTRVPLSSTRSIETRALKTLKERDAWLEKFSVLMSEPSEKSKAFFADRRKRRLGVGLSEAGGIVKEPDAS